MEKTYDLVDSAGRSWQDLQPIISSRLKATEGNPNVYWCCNGQPVWTKYQAMKNLAAGQPTHFYCFDQQWAAADWTNPTAVAVDDLLVDRAREIRRNNDFVRIAYSGGSDSHTVLTSFKKAGVAPDEIVFYTWAYELKSFFNSNFEIDKAVVPYIPVIQSWFPNTKIRHLNIDFEILKALRRLHPDYSMFELGAGLRSNPVLGAVSLFDQLDVGPGIVNVTGSDKPRLDYINGNWYAWSTDSSCLHVWGKNVEGFFQSADPTIFIRQCHDLKKYILDNSDVITRQSVTDLQTRNIGQSTRRSINLALGRHAPFDDSVNSRKYSKRPAPGIGEWHSKAVLFYRTIMRSPGGPELLSDWEKNKQKFKDETGYCPSIDVFTKFYNLDTGEIHTVDDLFPKGWHSK